MNDIGGQIIDISEINGHLIISRNITRGKFHAGYDISNVAIIKWSDK